MEILFESMSPATLEFFHNAFHRTRFTQRIENLKWPAGVALQVYGTRNSAITQSITEEALYQGKKMDVSSTEI